MGHIRKPAGVDGTVGYQLDSGDLANLVTRTWFSDAARTLVVVAEDDLTPQTALPAATWTGPYDDALPAGSYYLRHRVQLLAAGPFTVDDDDTVELYTVTGTVDGVAAWSPLPSDVGAHIPTRTVDATGVQTGTFNATTTPTLDQLDTLIAGVVQEIAATVGTVDTTLEDFARQVAALGAASSAELTFPRTSEDHNVSVELRARYESMLRRLAGGHRGLSGKRVGSVRLGHGQFATE